MENTLKNSLKIAVAFLENQGFRYAVIGGIALSQWGVVRVTRDVDIKVLVPDTDYDSVVSLIYENFPRKARPEVQDDSLIVSVLIDGVIVDFLLAVPGYEELIIERATRRDLEGLSVWISSAEDLVIQKAVAGREIDWPDIEALLIEQRGKFDRKYVENWLSQFAEALEDPEILTKYERLTQKIQNLS